MGAGENTVVFFKSVANPARGGTINVYTVVFLRIISMLLVIFSTIVLTLAMILRPWKLNAYKGAQMEVGVWTICRITPKIYRCYDNWYNENPIYWVYIWRAFMVIPIIVQVVAFGYLTIEVARNKSETMKHWTIASIASLFSATCLMSSLIVFYAKFEWEWAEQAFGWPIMGWNEETPDYVGYTEPPGYPYIMAWVAEITFCITSYACFYTKCQEVMYAAHAKLQKEREKMLKTIESSQL